MIEVLLTTDLEWIVGVGLGSFGVGYVSGFILLAFRKTAEKLT